MFTWTLESHTREPLAVSASAFPAITVAERDARLVQEFAEDLTLNLSVDLGEGVTWFADRDGLPAVFSPRFYPDRVHALKEATVAVGLLPVASVAGYAANAHAE